MTSFERIGSAPPVAATGALGESEPAAAAARTAMAAIGERVLAWSAASFGDSGGAAQWSARTGVASSGFAPDRAELARGGDVYDLRSLTAGIAGEFGASPAAEGALGRAVEDFARAASLHLNGRGGSAGAVDAVASKLDAALGGTGPAGIDGVTARIETAARMVEDLNR